MKQLTNVEKGRLFTSAVHDHLKSKEYCLDREFRVEVGINHDHNPKYHKFDLGNNSLLVECKSYSWTKGRNAPSAKFSTANEALLYFIAAPKPFRKMLFLQKTDKMSNRNAVEGGEETIAEQYVRKYKHFFPDKLEVWELDDKVNPPDATRLYPPKEHS